jgi:hypothetical protein
MLGKFKEKSSGFELFFGRRVYEGFNFHPYP